MSQQSSQALNKQSISNLLQHTGIWRASNIDCSFRQGIATGYPVLDRHLPGSGWPTDGLTELLHDKPGIGEFRLLSPALARLSQQQNRWLLWVAPPHIPYAPALAGAGIDLTKVLIVNPTTPSDTLWVLEKALASQSCSAVLAWPGHLKEKQLRRLQIASKEGHCLGILYRHSNAAKNSSPAELRIQLHACIPSPLSEHSCLQLKILKRKGGWQTDVFNIDFNDNLNQMTPDFSELRVLDHTVSEVELALVKTPYPSNQHVFQ